MKLPIDHEARVEAMTWRGMAWLLANALVQWEQMTVDDRARVQAKINELTPDMFRLPWEDATPDGQAPQWALDLVHSNPLGTQEGKQQ